jgi:hypothetical protein
MAKSGNLPKLGESTLVSNIKPIPMPEGAVPPRLPSERGGINGADHAMSDVVWSGAAHLHWQASILSLGWIPVARVADRNPKWTVGRWEVLRLTISHEQMSPHWLTVECYDTEHEARAACVKAVVGAMGGRIG